MDIVRNEDGTLVVAVERRVVGDEGKPIGPATRELRPGEGGYDEALAEWDRQQNPDREAAVSTASGRAQAMHAIHTVAESNAHDVTAAVLDLTDPDAGAEALRHVLVGGVHSVEDFAKEIAAAEGGDVLSPHEATKIIGEVLAAIDG